MPSTSDSRQPYRLSNLLFVTESLTLMAGSGSLPFFRRLYSDFTPVVVSSVMPYTFSTISGWWSMIRFVRSPPSSRIMLGRPSPEKPLIVWRRHHSYSSFVSPFHANTGIPALAIAAAAWSCVEKMLHDDQRISAPSATSVSMSTAVWIVMCRHPAIFAPLSGFDSPNSRRSSIRPGISFSAISMDLRPHSARLMSRTLNSVVMMNEG
mmetsp:Transcript_28618/g.50884  ORF Transcript_28618/g.50884 Transcript_28618/m.50884 type:complete len:208 (+) Transcript_28618:1008-1631(+)